MNIDNLEEAQKLGKELEQLRLARDLILGSGVMKVCSRDLLMVAVIEDANVMEKAVDAITWRIEDIHNRIKEL